MKLLLHPKVGIGEGPTGYMRRLADANKIGLGDLKKLGFTFDVESLQRLGCIPASGQDVELERYVSRLMHGFTDPRVAWVTRVGRYCPVCLTGNPRWRVGWELQFCDACPDHKVWLIDTCECGRLIFWDRREFGRCDCGRVFANVRATQCPEAVVNLSALLVHKLLGKDCGQDDKITMQLAPPQLQRLIRFLGTYGDIQPGPRPQKISFQDRLAVSWPITSLAAEILADWPNSLYRILDRLQRERADDGGGRLSGRFGFLYTALYKSFPEDEFSALRADFENYVADHWRGALGERNRRIPATLLERAAWIPANHACKRLGVSSARLSALIAENRISGESRLGPSGRIFIVVKRVDVERELTVLAKEVDLLTASQMLGVTKRRMLALLPRLFPDAYRTSKESSPWAVPRERLDRLAEITRNLTAIQLLPAGSTSLAHVMKFWAWEDWVLADALAGVIAHRIEPIGVLGRTKGVSGLVFREKELRDWFGRTQQTSTDALTLPEVAARLEVKQEVAYALVRAGLLPTVSIPSAGKREGQKVSLFALETFGQRYVFARDLAKSVGRSPKGLIEKLALLGLNPVCSPEVNGCRQVLYECRPELDNAMDRFRRAQLGHSRNF
jgi:hypothetical protein